MVLNCIVYVQYFLYLFDRRHCFSSHSMPPSATALSEGNQLHGYVKRTLLKTRYLYF